MNIYYVKCLADYKTKFICSTWLLRIDSESIDFFMTSNLEDHIYENEAIH